MARGNAGVGLNAVGAASMRAGEAVAEANGSAFFQGGFEASHGSALRARGARSEGNAGDGFGAMGASALDLTGVSSVDNADDGVSAEGGSWAWVGDGAEVTGSGSHGLTARHGGRLVTWGGVTVEASSGDGVHIFAGSSIDLVDDSIILDSGGFGVHPFDLSYAWVDEGVMLTGHPAGDFSRTVNSEDYSEIDVYDGE